MHSANPYVRRAAPLRRAGFTLIELLVTLAILGLVAAVVAPAITWRAPADDLTSAATELQGILGRVRQTALTQGTTMTLTLDPTRARCWIEQADMPANITADPSSMTRRRRDAENDAMPSDSIALPAGVVIVATAPRVKYVFAPTGSAFGDPMTLTQGGRSVTVALDHWTGSPRAQPR